MDRREFLYSTALAILVAPLAVEAQQVARTYKVGLVSVAVDPAAPTVLWQAFSEPCVG